MKWDLFISHASEDKADVARPLAHMLQAKGFSVWYDEYTLTLGDNLRRSIEQGLSQSQFGVVILSRSFFAKKWPNLELDGLFALEKPGEKRILPVWHNVAAGDVESYSSFMAMRLGVPTSKGLEHVVGQIDQAIQRERNGALQESPVAATPYLHPNTMELLDAGKVSNGTIMAMRHLGGFSVRAGGKSFGADGDARQEALNLHSLDELLMHGLAEQLGESVFELTQDGFDYEVPDGVIQTPQPDFPIMTPANDPHVKQILKAAVAGDGRIILVAYLGGDTLQAGGTAWESGGDRRTVARWKSVLRESAEKGLLLQNSDVFYCVSHLGYLWTDALNASEAES
jgi:hypothetical protein